ncbi:MAG: 50S ribosomal protein L25/general stress protein Ctc [Actinobacteria bacterium]|nr:50S ribosomal protein L25/general stress protein Ctc [Actinomycetota bacterium]
MAENFLIQAGSRERTGKGDARKLRKRGFVPGVVYGADKDPEHIFVDRNEISKLVHQETTILNLKIEGKNKPEQVIIRKFDKDPVSDEILHVDFQRVKMDEEISAIVPIILLNDEICVGVKKGGIIQHGIREVEVECLPKDLPSHIEVDIKDLDIGDTIKVADLVVPQGVKIAEDSEEIVVTIVPPVIYEEEEVTTEEAREVPTVAETEKKTED